MMKEKGILTTFTAPMMGLSYECEPIFRKLETHFAGQIAFREEPTARSWATS